MSRTPKPWRLRAFSRAMSRGDGRCVRGVVRVGRLARRTVERSFAGRASRVCPAAGWLDHDRAFPEPPLTHFSRFLIPGKRRIARGARRSRQGFPPRTHKRRVTNAPLPRSSEKASRYFAAATRDEEKYPSREKELPDRTRDPSGLITCRWKLLTEAAAHGADRRRLTRFFSRDAPPPKPLNPPPRPDPHDRAPIVTPPRPPSTRP